MSYASKEKIRLLKVCNQKICKKCAYRGIAIAGTITCDYISITGKKRGCPAGDCDKFIKGNPSKKKNHVRLEVDRRLT